MGTLEKVEIKIEETIKYYGYITNEYICKICIEAGLDIASVDRVFDKIFMKDSIVVDAPEMISNPFLKKYIRNLIDSNSNKKTTVIEKEKKTFIPRIEAVLTYLYYVKEDVFEDYARKDNWKWLEDVLKNLIDFEYDKKFVLEYIDYCKYLAEIEKQNSYTADEQIIFDFLNERAGHLYRPEVISRNVGIQKDLVIKLLDESNWAKNKWGSYFISAKKDDSYASKREEKKSAITNFDYIKTLSVDELAKLLTFIANKGEHFFGDGTFSEERVDYTKAKGWMLREYNIGSSNKEVGEHINELSSSDNYTDTIKEQSSANDIKEEFIKYLRHERFVSSVIYSYIDELDSFFIDDVKTLKVFDCKDLGEIENCILKAKNAAPTLRAALRYYKGFFKARENNFTEFDGTHDEDAGTGLIQVNNFNQFLKDMDYSEDVRKLCIRLLNDYNLRNGKSMFSITTSKKCEELLSDIKREHNSALNMAINLYLLFLDSNYAKIVEEIKPVYSRTSIVTVEKEDAADNNINRFEKWMESKKFGIAKISRYISILNEDKKVSKKYGRMPICEIINDDIIQEIVNEREELRGYSAQMMIENYRMFLKETFE
ncbi:MAG: hypothetical protein K5769_02745 [Pseudobutyrivibrio sp.]|nr:hypothetical protein [Pseudobutyrivibrio sp.]